MCARQRRAHQRHRAGQDALDGRPRSGIRHVRNIDAGRDLQQLAREMRRRSDAGTGVAQLVRIGLRARDQLRDRGDAGGRRRDEHIGRRVQLGDRREVLERVVGRLLVERGIDHEGARHHHQRIAVGRAARDLRDPEIAAGAAAILHDERLAERFTELHGHEPRGEVARAAGRERHHDPHRAFGVTGGHGRTAERRRTDQCACPLQH